MTVEGDHGYKLLSTVLDIEQILVNWLKSAFSADCREALVSTETVPHMVQLKKHMEGTDLSWWGSQSR